MEGDAAIFMIDDVPGLQGKQAQSCSCGVGKLGGLMKNIFNLKLSVHACWLAEPHGEKLKL